MLSTPWLKERLLRSDLVAFGIIGDLIITTATIKNPAASYSKRVFRQSQSAHSSDNFKKRTRIYCHHPVHESNGYCQQLLTGLLKGVDHPLFATTRKASMIHILAKQGFTQTGKVYQEDLTLLVKKGFQSFLPLSWNRILSARSIHFDAFREAQIGRKSVKFQSKSLFLEETDGEVRPSGILKSRDLLS